MLLFLEIYNNLFRRPSKFNGRVFCVCILGIKNSKIQNFLKKLKKLQKRKKLPKGSYQTSQSDQSD